MDTTTTQSALDALRTAEFRLSLRGYDVDEVDDFLERAAVEADQLREQVRTTSAQATQAAERLRHLHGRLAHLLAQLVRLDRGSLEEVVDLVDVVATEAEAELCGAKRVKRCLLYTSDAADE